MKKKKMKRLLALGIAGLLAMSVITTAWAKTNDSAGNKSVEMQAEETEMETPKKEDISETETTENVSDVEETTSETIDSEKLENKEEPEADGVINPEENVTGAENEASPAIQAAGQSDYGTLTENGAVISGLKVNQIVDGTPVWDEDNQPGNDKDCSNRIVRSYDTITYTLAYTTEMKDESQQAFAEGDVNCRFVLPFTRETGEFLTSSMTWLMNPQVTVEEGRTVLTGTRHLTRGNAPCAIPGAGTLTVVVKVNGAPNNTIIEPEFSLWFSGNEESEIKTILCNQNPGAEQGNEYVTVSAAPGYNVKLVSAGRNQSILNYNPKTGKVEAKPVANVTRTGYLDKYVVVLQLANADSRKKLKGIERPKGEITFDLEIGAKKQPFNGSLSDSTTPLLWDYKNNAKDGKTTGILGREMAVGREESAFYEYAPVTASTKASVKMTQNKQLIHVTLTEYEFSDTLEKGPYSGNAGYLDHTYAFYAGYLQFVVDAPDGENTDYFSNISDGNLRAVSITGEALREVSTNENQTVLDDDRLTTQNIIITNGMIRKWQYPFAQRNADSSSWYRNGTMEDGGNMYTDEARAIGTFGIYRGQYFQLESVLSGNAVKRAYSANILQKFDDEAFAFDEDATSEDFVSWFPTTATIRMLFAAKPNGTGWDSDKEMERTNEEQLQYFTSMKEMLNQNVVCVGVLYEVRGQLYSNNEKDTPCMNLAPNKLRVRESAKTGEVYQCVNEALAWDEKNQLPITESVLNCAHSKVPTWIMRNGTEAYPSYVKTAYESDGSQKAGTHSGGAFSGQSVRILSNYTKVETTIDQQNADGTPKISYDVAAGQRQVDYVITPYLISDAEVNGETDTVTITMTLPQGLQYITESAFQGGAYVQDDISVGSGHLEDGRMLSPAVSEDGKTLTWVLEHQKVNEPMESIHFSAFIGNAENQEEDVKNGDAIKCTAATHGETEVSTPSYGRGSKASISLNVVKMTDLSVVKTVDKHLTECEEAFYYTVTYANTSQNTDFTGLKIMDVLPWSGDTRGSSFHGTYTIEEVTIQHARGAEIDLYYSEEEAVRANDAGNTDISRQEWKKAERTEGYVYQVSPNATAMVITGNLKVNDIIPVTYKLQPVDNMGGDIYGNTVTMSHPKLAATVKVPQVRTIVQERRLSGLVWEDNNQDGSQDADENKISGVTVTLLDMEGNSVTDIFEQEILPVLTGEDGTYAFRKLKDLQYQVLFSDGEQVKLGEWKASPVQAEGVDENKNSDGTPEYKEEKLIKSGISNIAFEEINETNPLAEIVHLDQGLYKELVPTETPEPTKTPNPTQTPEPTETDKPTVTGSPTPTVTGKPVVTTVDHPSSGSGDSPAKGSSTGEKVKTGDGTPILSFALLLFLSALSIVFTRTIQQIRHKQRA